VTIDGKITVASAKIKSWGGDNRDVDVLEILNK